MWYSVLRQGFVRVPVSVLCVTPRTVSVLLMVGLSQGPTPGAPSQSQPPGSGVKNTKGTKRRVGEGVWPQREEGCLPGQGHGGRTMLTGLKDMAQG